MLRSRLETFPALITGAVQAGPHKQKVSGSSADTAYVDSTGREHFLIPQGVAYAIEQPEQEHEKPKHAPHHNQPAIVAKPGPRKAQEDAEDHPKQRQLHQSRQISPEMDIKEPLFVL